MNNDQPMPKMGRVSVTEKFRDEFVHAGAERDMVGLERYGTALRTWNGRDAGVDAWQEWYDLGKYLAQLRLEYDDLVAERDALRAEVERLRRLHADAPRLTGLREIGVDEGAS